MEVEKKENRDYCLRVARDLENYCFGQMVKCPHCGERFVFNKEMRCDSCGETLTEAELSDNTLSIDDYFDNVFNITYYIDSTKHYAGVRVMVACGGPNIYIDTYRKQIELFWWTDYAAAKIYSDVSDCIDDIFRDNYYI